MRGSVILLKRFSREENHVTIDLKKQTCSCSMFEGADCKHLNAVGIYRKQQVRLTNTPDNYQALSAVVKGIRLRDVETAAYWTLFLLRKRMQVPGTRFRLARRLLQGAAEDGMSVAVMERVADGFAPLCHDGCDELKYLAEIIRICKVPNWWHTDTDGEPYLKLWVEQVHRREYLGDAPELSILDPYSVMNEGLDAGNENLAFMGMMQALDAPGMKKAMMAQRLSQLAEKAGNEVARQIALVHLKHPAALEVDCNFLGQALFRLFHPDHPVINACETVWKSEVMDLWTRADAAINCESPPVMPSWCVDGIHCRGADARFSGMEQCMVAACRAFRHYNRLHPDDEWLPAFYPVEWLQEVV